MGSDRREGVISLSQPPIGGHHSPRCPLTTVRGNFRPPRCVPTYSETAVSDDAQLIDQALRGQSEAFGQLVLKYQDRLFNTVFHVVGHAEDARDIVQEALVQAFLKLEFVPPRERVLYLAVSDRLQPGGQPPAATPAGGVARRPAGDRQHGTSRTTKTTRPKAWSGKNAAARCGGRSHNWPMNIAACWCCGRSTAAATKRSPKSSICRSTPSAAGCIGRGCN